MTAHVIAIWCGCGLTTGVHEVLSQLEGLWLSPVKQVWVVDTLPQLCENVHQSSLTTCLPKGS